MTDRIPDFSESLADVSGKATRNWYNFWKGLQSQSDSGAGTISTGVAAGALTISFSPSDAAPLVISSGSTLGTANNVPFRIWVVEFDDAGTLRLGAINCRMTSSVAQIAAYALQSSTAEGGAGAADSAGVFYTGVAVSSMPMRILGFLTWESGLTTAGTWDADPDAIVPFASGIPLPGNTIQAVTATGGVQATATTTTFVDVTSLTASMTLTSAANSIAYGWDGPAQTTAANGGALCALRRGGVIVGNTAAAYAASSTIISTVGGSGTDFTGTIGPISYVLSVQLISGTGNAVLPANFGGAASIQIAEVMV